VGTAGSAHQPPPPEGRARPTTRARLPASVPTAGPNCRTTALGAARTLVLPLVVPQDKAATDKAYKKFWAEVEQFDLACKKKEQALATKEYDDMLKAMDAYVGLV